MNQIAFMHLTGDGRFPHLRHSRDAKLLDLLFGRGVGRGAVESRRQSYGDVPRYSEAKTSTAEVCSTYLAAMRAHEIEPTDETTTALATAKRTLIGRLQATPRKRITALGCVFHLHAADPEQAPGVSVHRKLAKHGRIVPALQPGVAPT